MAPVYVQNKYVPIPPHFPSFVSSAVSLRISANNFRVSNLGHSNEKNESLATYRMAPGDL